MTHFLYVGYIGSSDTYCTVTSENVSVLLNSSSVYIEENNLSVRG
jgi:hypothetical protein